MLPSAVAPARDRFFINHRPFQITEPELTGAELAALLGVPADNAVVEAERGGDLATVELDERVALRPGDSFLVTRQFIMGGSSEARV